MTALPETYITRSATLDDVPLAVALSNAQAIALTGKPNTAEDDVRNEWQQPTLNLDTDTRIVLTPEGTAVGFAGVWDSEPHVKLYSWTNVHPDYYGQGIGTYLSTWLEKRARQAVPLAPEGTCVSLAQSKLENDATGRAFLRDRGYQPVRHFLRMVIELTSPPPAPQLPEGLTIRSFPDTPEEREPWLRTLLNASREAFRDHWGYVETPFEEEVAEWQHWMDSNPFYDPSLWFLGMDGDEIAGLCLVQPQMVEDPDAAYVDTVCIRPAWRRQGLALALLHHTFGELYRRGKRRAYLHVDATSLTGATRLYEKAGMSLDRQSTQYELELRAGKDLSTQTLEDA